MAGNNGTHFSSRGYWERTGKDTVVPTRQDIIDENYRRVAKTHMEEIKIAKARVDKHRAEKELARREREKEIQERYDKVMKAQEQQRRTTLEKNRAILKKQDRHEIARKRRLTRDQVALYNTEMAKEQKKRQQEQRLADKTCDWKTLAKIRQEELDAIESRRMNKKKRAEELAEQMQQKEVERDYQRVIEIEERRQAEREEEIIAKAMKKEKEMLHRWERQCWDRPRPKTPGREKLKRADEDPQKVSPRDDHYAAVLDRRKREFDEKLRLKQENSNIQATRKILEKFRKEDQEKQAFLDRNCELLQAEQLEEFRQLQIREEQEKLAKKKLYKETLVGQIRENELVRNALRKKEKEIDRRVFDVDRMYNNEKLLKKQQQYQYDVKCEAENMAMAAEKRILKKKEKEKIEVKAPQIRHRWMAELDREEEQRLEAEGREIQSPGSYEDSEERSRCHTPGDPYIKQFRHYDTEETRFIRYKQAVQNWGGVLPGKKSSFLPAMHRAPQIPRRGIKAGRPVVLPKIP